LESCLTKSKKLFGPFTYKDVKQVDSNMQKVFVVALRKQKQPKIISKEMEETLSHGS